MSALSKAQLTAALVAAGVKIPRKANLATLTDLYAQHIAATATVVDYGTGFLDATDAHMLAEINAALPAAEEARIAQLEEAATTEIETTDEMLAAIDWSQLTHAQVADSNCPNCGIHLSNGLLHITDCPSNSDQSYGQLRNPDFAKGEWNCMGCGHHFGETTEYPAPVQGLKIEKVRPEQNGVKRPSIGGKCRAIWDALDAYRTETGEMPTSKVVKALAADEGWNPNNASIEYYQWRKFNGIAKGQ